MIFGDEVTFVYMLFGGYLWVSSVLVQVLCCLLLFAYNGPYLKVYPTFLVSA